MQSNETEREELKEQTSYVRAILLANGMWPSDYQGEKAIKEIMAFALDREHRKTLEAQIWILQELVIRTPKDEPLEPVIERWLATLQSQLPKKEENHE